MEKRPSSRISHTNKISPPRRSDPFEEWENDDDSAKIPIASNVADPKRRVQPHSEIPHEMGNRSRPRTAPPQARPTRNGKARAEKKTKTRTPLSERDPIAAIEKAADTLNGLKGYSFSTVFSNIGIWIYEHKIVILIAGLLAIIIGVMFNRYISWGTAISIVAIGAAITRIDEEYDGTLFYVCGLIIFIIPFLY